MTHVTSKGQQVESPFTDAEAARVVELMVKTSFGRDLAAAFRRGRLSKNQRPWLHKLAVEWSEQAKNPQPKPAPKTAPVDLSAIVALLKTAAKKLKFPKITLDNENGALRLQVCGSRSKYAGSISLTDGEPFGSNVWYGTITAQGALEGSQRCPEWVVSALTAMASDPAGYAAKYGKKTGNCCFCTRPLVTVESTTVGYGPVCAKNYGLPWGQLAYVAAGTSEEEETACVHANVENVREWPAMGGFIGECVECKSTVSFVDGAKATYSDVERANRETAAQDAHWDAEYAKQEAAQERAAFLSDLDFQAFPRDASGRCVGGLL